MDAKRFEFDNSQDAWEGINEYLLLNEKKILKEGGVQYGPALKMYDVFVQINDGRIDPEFNFGKVLGYSIQKWTGLINNYIDMNYFEGIKSKVMERELKKGGGKSYNISFLFDDSHGSGKGCLLTATFMRRIGYDQPFIHVNIRASEVTKRLIFDLLLFQRMGEYVYGKDQPFGVNLMITDAFISVESIIMYNTHKKIVPMMRKALGKNKSEWGLYQQKAYQLYKKYSTINPELVTFKVHQRSAKQIQTDKDGNPLSGVKDMFAKDLTFGLTELEFPENVISPSQKRAYRRQQKSKS